MRLFGDELVQLDYEEEKIGKVDITIDAYVREERVSQGLDSAFKSMGIDKYTKNYNKAMLRRLSIIRKKKLKALKCSQTKH